MERRHLRSQQQQNVPPRESVVSWITETTRASMEFHYPEQSADSSSTQFDSQNTEDDNPPAYIPGQIITTCRPFVHIVTEEMKGRICDLCLRAPSSSSSNSSTSSKANQNNSKLRCCSDCQAMYFCGSCLASTTPSVFKALHALECPIYASYNAALSNPSKFFLRLYLRLENSESIPHTQQTVYFNPLTREELDFETLVPRLIYTSREEMTEHIQDFCERNSLKVYGGSEQAVSANSPVGSISSSSSSKGAKNRRNKRQNNRGEVGQQQPPPNRTYKSVADFHLQGDTSSVEEIAVYQFMNLLEEFSRVEPLLPFIADDHQIYRLWNVFVRLWSYATPIVDEAVSGILSDGSSSAIAYGLYLEPNSVLFGHSCVPNTAFAFYGPVLQLRAMKPIFPGDSLAVNLVQLAVPQAERLRQLRSYFISTCFCPRCRGKSEAEVEEEEEGGGRDGDGQLSASDYERFRALKEEFGALFEAAFVTTPATAETSTKTPLSLSAILNFTSGGGGDGGGGGEGFDEQTIAQSSAQCEKLHRLLERLLPLLGKIYPYEHPEKTRLAYAHTVVEMNRLLFKLDGRAAATAAVVSGEEGEKEGGGAGVQSSMSHRRNLARMSDFSASVSPRAGNLDALTEEITAWSALLKSTVKAIRGTHGLDHRLYREVPVPLAPVWSRALALGGGGSTCSSGCSAALSIGELHRDPAVLLRILIHSGGGGGQDQRPRSDRHSKPHGFSIGAHLESISRAFSQLFAEAYEGGGGGGGGQSDGRRQLTASTNSSSILSDVADDGTDDDDHTWQTFCRTLLIVLALLFPFLIYYVVYVEDRHYFNQKPFKPISSSSFKVLKSSLLCFYFVSFFKSPPPSSIEGDRVEAQQLQPAQAGNGVHRGAAQADASKLKQAQPREVQVQRRQTAVGHCGTTRELEWSC
ncbi:SET and MYND domain-containing protein 3 [Tyrophagus putrescentiae]|nr:SET and MYND domain-containing protein 3 [Tyrophagus putrescentiae]